MIDSHSFLDAIDIASPCSADWDDMTGDERIRFCADCKLNVYNLSEMSEDEAIRTVQEAEGRLCVSFFRRPDGTMITSDCPVGVAAIRWRARLAGARLVAMLGLLWAGMLNGCGLRQPAETARPTIEPAPTSESTPTTETPNSDCSVETPLRRPIEGLIETYRRDPKRERVRLLGKVLIRRSKPLPKEDG